jgi:hypothetical protein
MKNFGLMQEPGVEIKDWRMGGVTGIVPEVLQESGDWTEFLPVYEPQKITYDTMSCVTFSALNCLETMYSRRYGIEENFSDRFTAKVSRTTPSGNYLSRVANSILNYGMVSEALWPYGGNNWSAYMADIPLDLIQAGQNSLDKYKINWEWVVERDAKTIMEALTYSPLQVTVYAWESPQNGIYQKTEKTTNHAVMLYDYKKYEYWVIYDHYENNIKRLAWDFKFGHRLRYNIEDYMPKPKFEDNLLLQLVEGAGGFGMTLDGKLIVDDLDKVTASWITRNNGDIKGKVLAVTEEDWNDLEKINLKKEPV